MQTRFTGQMDEQTDTQPYASPLGYKKRCSVYRNFHKLKKKKPPLYFQVPIYKYSIQILNKFYRPNLAII